jgi:ABC-2 type transport system ATP-binding protein
VIRNVPPDPGENLVVLTGLQKVINQVTVVDIASLLVLAGQCVAIVGPVDSGKDILLRLLIGAIRPTAGSVRLAGLDPYTQREACSRLMGVLFADDNLYKRMSVAGNLRFFGRLYRLPESRVTETLEQVGLADQAQVAVEKLSPGLTRRLALGRALLTRPRILLLANPFADCEQASVTLITQVLRQQVDGGAAILVLAVDLAGLEDLCSAIHRFEQGRIVESYNPREALQPARPFMVPARVEDKIILVDPTDILYVVAQDDRAFLQTSTGILPTQFTLTELEKRLSRSGFFRAHRAYLVNLQQVKEVIPYTRNSYTLRLKDTAGTEIPLSKAAERELRDLLGY